MSETDPVIFLAPVLLPHGQITTVGFPTQEAAHEACLKFDEDCAAYSAKVRAADAGSTPDRDILK